MSDLILTPASVADLALSQRLLNLTGLSFTNSSLITQSGHPAADIPVGTTVFELDTYGNIAVGENPLLTVKTGNLLANGRVPTGMFYQQESRYLYVGAGGVNLVAVGDPSDLTFARFGPDNSWPDNDGLGVAGVPSGTSLGAIRWRGGVTPQGGTADVTLGAFIQSESAAIYAKSTEDNKQTGASTYQQGGELYFSTTPNGTSTSVEAVAIRNTGQVDVLVGPLKVLSSEVQTKLSLEAYNLGAWSYDTVLAQNGQALTSQKAYFTAVPLKQGQVVTNLWVKLVGAAAGADPTTIKLGLYNTSGTRLAVTANVASSASWDSTGHKSFAVTSPHTVTANGLYYVAVLIDGTFGTTQPSFARNAGGGASDTLNSKYPYGNLGTGQTDLGTSMTPATDTAHVWAAVN